MGEQTSIPVSKTARDELAETKPDAMSWSAYLVALRDESDQLKQLAGADRPSLSYDDVKSACSAAIREELPISEMGR